MKQKIEIEIDVPDGYELDYASTQKQESWLETGTPFIRGSTIVYLKPIEPPLELETEALVHKGEIDSDFIFLDKDGKLDIHINSVANNRYVRVSDVIAVLSHYERTGKLPKVITKKGELL